ncbi:3-oxoacyl-ACP reductase [Lentilactobacillus raoultii]|uniref:3-oxoacyl-ACP reductase n=1 Tax=Lentilactobacillus raoultii TaxID=1987503 RepID=A0ABW3PSG4_9LACO|nr:3-oxoacyl-ACP reductase [Lentilactobacillus raoultii]
MVKTVLVTGGSRGLGAQIVNQFSKIGYNVVINYYQHQNLADRLVSQIGDDKAIALKADVRNRQEVDRMTELALKKFGSIDTVVNNALVGFKFDPIAQKSFIELKWDDYQAQLDGTLKGAFNVIQSVLSSMIKHHFGQIVSIGTNLYQNPVVAYHQYTTAKAALIGFSRNLAVELGKYGITVNVVSGGLLKTTDASSATTPEVFKMIQENTPLRKVTTPEDVAKMVAFLGSEPGRGLTGQNVTVDGGLTMN